MTLSASTKVANPGQAITVTGKNFSTAAGASSVAIRLKTRSGQVLTTTTPDGTNRISTTFSLPASLSPGWYVLLATQTVNGQPKSGTPGRTTIRVQGSAQSSAAATPAPWDARPSGPSLSAAPVADGGPAGWAILPIAMLLSLAMLASGWMLIGRTRRSVSGPQLGV